MFLLQLLNKGFILEWRLFDAAMATMQEGKRIELKEVYQKAKHIAFLINLWITLTGQEGFFSTKLAYCMETLHGKHRGSDIYLALPTWLVT